MTLDAVPVVCQGTRPAVPGFIAGVLDRRLGMRPDSLPKYESHRIGNYGESSIIIDDVLELLFESWEWEILGEPSVGNYSPLDRTKKARCWP